VDGWDCKVQVLYNKLYVPTTVKLADDAEPDSQIQVKHEDGADPRIVTPTDGDDGRTAIALGVFGGLAVVLSLISFAERDTRLRLSP
jgi:hypothetical protein